MEQSEKASQKMSPREKLTTTVITLVFAGVGAVLGIIAYYQNWLG